MATRERRPERRQEPLSRERIVDAAVELLDTAGERGLTFRALAERLATGPGAIYWHVTGKAELLAAATDAVIAPAVAPAVAPADTEATPEQAIRTLALGIFDALDTHPWAGPQLTLAERHSPLLRVFEGIGRQVQALGVPESTRFTAASALMSYILGVAGQNAAGSWSVPRAPTRPPTSARSPTAGWNSTPPTTRSPARSPGSSASTTTRRSSWPGSI